MTTGSIYWTSYPRQNLLNVESERTTRLVQLLEKVSIAKSGIFIDAFLRRPWIRRTETRDRVFDYAAFGERQFYDPDAAPVDLQLCLFDPLSGERGEELTEAFPQNQEGVEELIAICSEITKSAAYKQGRFSAAIFAAEAA